MLSANLGLDGKAISGNKWFRVHRPQLRRQLRQMLEFNNGVRGLLLCELGDVENGLTAERRARIIELLRDVFRDEEPEIVWPQSNESDGETLTVTAVASFAEIRAPMLIPYGGLITQITPSSNMQLIKRNRSSSAMAMQIPDT